MDGPALAELKVDEIIFFFLTFVYCSLQRVFRFTEDDNFNHLWINIVHVKDMSSEYFRVI